jgi:hypothetical protein|tara:strand:- start:1276 stop:2127 length:852 start_codon:yes stop_codon:yes gene_type:complete
MPYFNFDTPIEEHTCGENKVWVKRDDLLNGDLDLPPWAKMEGIKRVLESGDLDKSIPIIHLSVRVSYSGWALAYIGRELGYDIKIAYPDSKNYPKEILDKIKQYGAELVPVKPNLLDIVNTYVKRVADEKGYQQMPYAFNHPAYIDYFSERMKTIQEEYDFDNIVINAGSGVTGSALLKGFMDYDNFIPQKKAYLITTAGKQSIERMLKKWDMYHHKNVFISETEHDFFDGMDWLETPFPCNGNWDKKAWFWLQNNKLEGKTLFYNLGGENMENIAKKDLTLI